MPKCSKNEVVVPKEEEELIQVINFLLPWLNDSVIVLLLYIVYLYTIHV